MKTLTQKTKKPNNPATKTKIQENKIKTKPKPHKLDQTSPKSSKFCLIPTPNITVQNKPKLKNHKFPENTENPKSGIHKYNKIQKSRNYRKFIQNSKIQEKPPKIQKIPKFHPKPRKFN